MIEKTNLDYSVIPMTKFKTIGYFLVCFIAFFLPIEHKYDKLFRHFSQKIIPNNFVSDVPFDFNIYFYPSDIAAILLLGILLKNSGVKFFFKDNALLFLGIFLTFCFLSVCNSPLAGYLTIYTRLFGYISPVIIFCFLSNLYIDEKKIQTIVLILIFSSLFQAGISITQYFSQGYLGLRILGESKDALASFQNIGGNLWLLDYFKESPSDFFKLRRASGTFSNCNPLGGFLALGCLGNIYFLSIFDNKVLKTLFVCSFFFLFTAIVLSFSRSALFSFLIASSIFYISIFKYTSITNFIEINFSIRSVLILIIFVCILFSEQIFARGGVFGYTPYSLNSDLSRLGAQKIAFSMILDHPWLGVGFQQYSLSAVKYGNATGVHNIFLFVAVESGIFAACALIGFVISVLKQGVRFFWDPLMQILISMFLCLLFIGFCDFYPILFQQGRLMTFIVSGLIIARKNNLYQEAALIRV